MHDLNAALQEAETALQIASMGRNKISLTEALLANGELLAEVRGRERDVIETLERFLQVSKRPPGMDVTWSRVYEMLGDAYSTINEHEKAISAYYSVLAYNPYHPWEVSVYYRIGRAYYRKENYAKAVDTIAHALHLAEDNPSLVDYRLYDTYGGALFALSRFTEAADAYTHALNLIPNDHEHADKIRHYQKLALEKANVAL
jgi:tetratricopeptide (TPR) repeat protein